MKDQQLQQLQRNMKAKDGQLQQQQGDIEVKDRQLQQLQNEIEGKKEDILVKSKHAEVSHSSSNSYFLKEAHTVAMHNVLIVVL